MRNVRYRLLLSAAATIATLGVALLITHNNARAVARPALGGCTSNCLKIKHIFIIVKENHTFDNIFGTFPGADGATTASEGVNTVPMGQTPDALSQDISHSYQSALKGIDGGKMDGFYLIAGAQQNGMNAADSEYSQSQIPLYWQYAQHYALADHFFSTIVGPSFPNHLVLIQGHSNDAINNPNNASTSVSSGGTGVARWGCDAPSNSRVQVYRNGTISKVPPCFDTKTVADEANLAGVTWRYYAPKRGQQGYIWSAFDAIKHIRNSSQWTTNVLPSAQFQSDVQTNKAAEINWLMPPFDQSEHPDASECVGENWTVNQVNAIMHSAYWGNSVIIVTWDDFGGFYDHVPPPNYGPEGLGPRVPFLLISPFTKTGFIDSTTYDFRSVVRFVEQAFALPHKASFNRGSVASIDNMLDLNRNATDTDKKPLELTPLTCSGSSPAKAAKGWHGQD